MAGFISKEYPSGGVYLFEGKHGIENGQNWSRQGRLRTSSINQTSLEKMRNYVEKPKFKSPGRMIQIISMENFFIRRKWPHNTGLLFLRQRYARERNTGN